MCREAAGAAAADRRGTMEETARELASREFTNGYRSISGPVRSRSGTARAGNCIPGSSRCFSF